tara:strand:+ start:59 stop:355 length:297 start_codon:yes stop_codon:yes gene_type:complete
MARLSKKDLKQGTGFLADHAKKKFFKELQLLFINVEYKRNYIQKKTSEIAEAEHLIQQNKNEILINKKLLQGFEEKLVIALNRICVNKDGTREVKYDG